MGPWAKHWYTIGGQRPHKLAIFYKFYFNTVLGKKAKKLGNNVKFATVKGYKGLSKFNKPPDLLLQCRDIMKHWIPNSTPNKASNIIMTFVQPANLNMTASDTIYKGPPKALEQILYCLYLFYGLSLQANCHF